jgi:hypothetical protein
LSTPSNLKSTFHALNSAVSYIARLLVMQWFRANLKLGSRLALLALTLQIVLSFGHVHLGDFRHTVGGLASAGTQSVPSAPTRQPASDADEYCAICAGIQLAATSLLPQAPRLPVPLASRPLEPVNCAAAISFSARRAPFQSRAPPLA